MKINNIKNWLDKCKDSCFAIQLPSGWLGRPLDNQHRLEDYSIDTKKISIKFDEGRELIIYDYANTTFEVDQNNNYLVKFSSFSKIEFHWFPYDKSIADKTIQIFKDGELILYGKYFR